MRRLFDDTLTKFVRIPKQMRYVLASSLGAICLFLAIGVPYPYYWIILPFLCLIGYILTWFALLEDIKRGEWYILFILPVAWTACWYIFYYMVPMRLATRLLFSVTYPVVMYIILSAMNIFNVGVGKNIQLLRAAQAANQFLNVLVFYIITQVMSVFGLNWIILGLSTGLFAGMLGMQLFWTLTPSETISQAVKNLGLFQGFTVGYCMALLSFLAFNLNTPRPMIITGIFYVIGGILSHYEDKILFRQRLREYSIILILLAIATLLTLQ